MTDEQLQRIHDIEYSCDSREELAERIVSLEDDNAKLLEQCANMFTCICHANEQDWFYFERDKTGCGMSCTVNGEGCGLSVLANNMRELGIEVDG